MSTQVPQHSWTNMGAKVMDPVNLLESVPPNVNSPLVISSVFVGAKDTATKFWPIVPCLKRLSVGQ